MPRGGGFSGGFRGGGGGFRGGGFRGSSSSFRSSFRSSSYSSSRPFGRTGARRTVTSSRRGPYSHSYRRPHRRYYHSPYYRRWWYRPWWGYYYRPWYYSPVYVGGGLVIAIIFMLILLPLIGVALTFPGSNYDASGVINYRSTEVINFNEYWYEYENVEAGTEITFSVQSTDVISFAIADHPFDAFPLSTVTGNSNYSIILQHNYYEYYSIYLRPGSVVHYDFNSSAAIDFFITDINNFNNWYYEEPTDFYYENLAVDEDSGIYGVSSNEDLYLVWYNAGGLDVNVDISLSYEANGVPDFTNAEYFEIAVDHISKTTITVPIDGNWYFFVYFDPMNSPEEGVELTFDVSYETDKTSVDQWIDYRPTLIFFGVIAGIIIIFAIVARKTQKEKKIKQGTAATTSTTTTTTTTTAPSKSAIYGKTTQKPKVSTIKCIRCGASMKLGDIFCPDCGGKVSGRKIGGTTKITPAKSKICSYCGSKLVPIDNFCKYCGTRVGK